MEKKDKEKIIEEFNHLIHCLNTGQVALDARALAFINKFEDYLK